MWCVPSRYEYDVDVVRTSEGWQKMKGGNDPACGLNVMRFMVDSLACSALFMVSFVKSTFDPFFRRPPGGGYWEAVVWSMMDAFDDKKFDRVRPPTVKGARRTNNNNSSIDIQSNCVAILGSALNSVVSKQSHEITSSSSRVFHLSISICILHKQSALRMTTITNCRK